MLRATQTVLSRKEELLEVDDPDMLYAMLGKLPQPLDLELLISKTISLYASHPPESLRGSAWRKVSSYSVLKATRTPQDVMSQTIPQAEELFLKQERELKRQLAFASALKRAKTNYRLYKRPAGAVGLAVAIGLYSWWLGRSGGSNYPYMGLQMLFNFIKKVSDFFD